MPIYRKGLQKLYKTIKDINTMVLIIWYQLNEEEKDIVERNKAGVTVQAKDVLLNYSKAISNYL